MSAQRLTPRDATQAPTAPRRGRPGAGAPQRSLITRSPVELIATKRDGGEHSPDEIDTLIKQLMRGSLSDYQMSAWLMAAYLRGLSEAEMVALTDAMLRSGTQLELRSVNAPTVDKHSTGGVGDKISLCLGPLVAACGAAVPMIAGRGLGHTGGTLDKLESIEGYQVHLSARRFERVVRDAGVSIMGQTADLAPADKRIYALRDVTGTVACLPLIVASILSKKLAEGIDALVLDVKAGRGAFMPTLAEAEALAAALVRVGRRSGKRVTALLTRMDAPLGLTIGNALELREAIDVLMGAGPEDVHRLTLDLGEEMLVSARVHTNRQRARRALQRAIDDGSGLERLARMVHLHGGDASLVHHPERLPRAPRRVEVLAPASGYLTRVDALQLGRLSVALGAGRRRAEDPVDPAVGIQLLHRPGAHVEAGEPLALLHLRRASDAKRHLELAAGAFGLSTRRPRELPLVVQRLR